MSLDAEIHVTVGTFEQRLHLTVAGGEVVAVLGPNGSGKTTLLRTLAGLQPLREGRIVLDGQVLDDPAAGVLVPPEARPCGMLFQDYLLFPHLTVVENVAFGLRSRGTPKGEAHRGALEWLGRVGLAEKARSKPGQLSGGQAQRVALGRTLATCPKLLLLDEPMAALDIGARGSVRHELQSQLRSFSGSSLLVTHDPLDAAALADRVIIVEEGTVAQEGTLEEITTRPRTRYVAELMGLNLLRARANGTTLVLANGATLEGGMPAIGDVLVAIAPTSIALYLTEPDGSPRNTWLTRVVAVHLLGDRARVLMDAPIPLAAEVTTGALAQLGLTEGVPVWASVKATQIDTYGAADGAR